MGTRALTIAAACAVALGAAGCGSGAKKPVASGSTPPPVPAKADKRGVALACLRDRERLPIKAVGEKTIEVGGPLGPRIDFFQSSLEAEAHQFEGKAEGTEQIGAALLFVRNTSNGELAKIEDCLDDQ